MWSKLAGKPPSSRQLKVAENIRHALIEVFKYKKQLPKILIDQSITVTEVQVTANLKIAFCYVLPFGNNLAKDEFINALNEAKNAVRKMVTSKIHVKYSPELQFIYDESFDNASNINKIMKQVQNNDSEE